MDYSPQDWAKKTAGERRNTGMEKKKWIYGLQPTGLGEKKPQAGEEKSCAAEKKAAPGGAAKN